jgi:putative Holliday junction resolvase
MSRYIGLDHGSRRIGVAVGDSETAMAFPRPAIRRRGGAADLEAVRFLAEGEGARIVVLGLPRNMDGSEGPQAAAARAFGDALEGIGLEVAYVDERLTSWEAGERIGAAGGRPTRQSGELDSAAARLILQEYLDAQSRPDAALEAE